MTCRSDYYLKRGNSENVLASSGLKLGSEFFMVVTPFFLFRAEYDIVNVTIIVYTEIGKKQGNLRHLFSSEQNLCIMGILSVRGGIHAGERFFHG